jgi:hypothetical protein
MKLIFLLSLLLSSVYSLPIFPSSSVGATSPSTIALISSSIISASAKAQNTAILLQQEEETKQENVDTSSIVEETQPPPEEEETCPTNSEYGIPVERFAQLVSTHWQFDHLDSIKSNTYKIISQEFQEHIQISIDKKGEEEVVQQQQQQQQQQKTFSAKRKTNSMDMNMMDLEILHAQIFGAIQAHTEGSLHIAWDKLSDKLGQPAFEQFIKSVVLKHCTLEEEESLISSTCLKTKATEISLELDEYINLNLNNIFIALEKDILPNLLSTISKDLQDVLAYFNRLFLLQDNQHLYLQVKSYKSDLSAKLAALLEEMEVDVHLTDFFENYACLSRA